jgi:hypothetical protein
MYWALLTQGVGRWRSRIWHAAVMRSGMLTFIALVLLLAGLTFGWREHRLGQFAQLKKELSKRPVQNVTVKPGGQDVVQLQRSQIAGGNGPEFLTATLLPGRGMNLLQITAYLPQKGEVNLLASPPLQEGGEDPDGDGSRCQWGEEPVDGSGDRDALGGTNLWSEHTGRKKPDHDMARKPLDTADGWEGQLRSRRRGGRRWFVFEAAIRSSQYERDAGWW